jgi:hypothetical protein
MPRFIKNDPAELAEYIVGIGRGLIAFDGRPTAGKTPLALEMANRVGCTAVDADSFLVKQRGVFVDELRIDDMRHAIEAGGQLVLLSGVCAQRVLERLGIPAAAVVWVESASLLRLDQICCDFFEYDEGDMDAPTDLPLYKEVEAYIDTYDARRRCDVVYLNAYGQE